jgi:hypothetical protein
MTERGLVFIYPEYEMEVYKAMFDLPPAERTDFLFKAVAAGKGQILGVTDMTGPELAIELIKKGINAKSYTCKEPPIV